MLSDYRIIRITHNIKCLYLSSLTTCAHQMTREARMDSCGVRNLRVETIGFSFELIFTGTFTESTDGGPTHALLLVEYSTMREHKP